MIRRLWIVAKYSFIEGIRARFFIGVILSAFVIVVIGSVMGSIPYGRVDDLIARIAWGAIFFSGIILVAFYSIQTLTRERELRILNLMLSKPISRAEYALGKYAGIAALSTGAVFIQGAVLLGLLGILGERPHAYAQEWLIPSMSIAFKCGVLLAYAMFFATALTTPMVAIFATLTYYLLGAGAEDFLAYAKYLQSPALIRLAEVLHWTAPQFGLFDVERWIIYGVAMSGRVYVEAAMYYGGYAIVGLVLYVLASELRELS